MSINGIRSYALNSLSGTSNNVSNLQSQIDDNTSNININFNSISALQNRALDDETNITNLQQVTTNQSYLNGTTTFNDNVLFTGNLNNISTNVFSFLSNVTSDI